MCNVHFYMQVEIYLHNKYWMLQFLDTKKCLVFHSKCLEELSHNFSHYLLYVQTNKFRFMVLFLAKGLKEPLVSQQQI